VVQEIGEGRIKLEMTLDREELEGQLGQVFRATDPSGGGVPAGPAGGRPGGPLGAEERRVERSDRREERSDSKKSLRYLAKLGGIALGITAMVKSSQVMTTTLGALNSVLGGMIDSFLDFIIISQVIRSCYGCINRNINTIIQVIHCSRIKGFCAGFFITFNRTYCISRSSPFSSIRNNIFFTTTFGKNKSI